MNNIKEYMESLARKIETTAQHNEIEILRGISEELFEIATAMKKVRAMFGTTAATVETNDSEFNGAFDDDLENIEAQAIEYGKRADTLIEAVEEEIAEIAEFGTMEEQASSDYYANQI